MSKIRDFFNRIFKKNSTQMIADVTKQNYDEYRITYDTLSKIFSNLDGIDIFLVGGISAPIQTSQDLYRQNSDIDIMCKEEDLPLLIETLQKIGYTIDDRRGIKTRNIVDSNGNFQPMDHELNADTKNNLLGIGIFTYKIRGNEVITYSYAFDEKEGKVVGTEKVMPKELFDLIYDSKTVDYKGLKLKTQSKEYIYITKSNESREKDKLDAEVVKKALDNESEAKIARIKELEAKTRTYRIVYDKDGKIESKTKLPTLEEKINAYLDNLFMKSPNKTPEEIIKEVLQSDEYHGLIDNHPEIDNLIKGWQEKSKKHTYKDKIDLLTKSYSKKLERFSKETIDNALDFLHKRYINHGRNIDDIELSSEAKEIFKLMEEYRQAIKKIFVENNIDIVHITAVKPENLKDGVLKKSIDKANYYETERVDGVFASSEPVDGSNPYIARNSSGMIRLNEFTYIYGSDNINITQDSDGKKHAILKQPNYIYYINPESFVPVCNLTINPYTLKPVFEFSQEWISDTPIDISDKKQVRHIDEVADVTSLLEHYTILCDVQSQGVGIKARQLSKENAFQYIIEQINNGNVRNINNETGINDRDFSGIFR